jgi:hypothetical protein
MRSPNSNPRHVIDSIKTLDSLAVGGAEAATAGAKFEIIINMGADCIEHYSKSIEINPNDDDDTAQSTVAAIAKDGDNGGHL